HGAHLLRREVRDTPTNGCTKGRTRGPGRAFAVSGRCRVLRAVRGDGQTGRGTLLADVGHQRHEAGPLDGVLDDALGAVAVAAELAAEELARAGAELLQRLHVLVIDESRPGTTFFGAEPAAILPAPPELLADHRVLCLDRPNLGNVPAEQALNLGLPPPRVKRALPVDGPRPVR